MLQNAPPFSDALKRGLEATAIIPQQKARPGGWRAAPISPPSLARRMSHDRIWAGIFARIAFFVPRVHVQQPVVWAILENVKGRYQDASSFVLGGGSLLIPSFLSARCGGMPSLHRCPRLRAYVLDGNHSRAMTCSPGMGDVPPPPSPRRVAGLSHLLPSPSRWTAGRA